MNGPSDNSKTDLTTPPSLTSPKPQVSPGTPHPVAIPVGPGRSNLSPTPGKGDVPEYQCDGMSPLPEDLWEAYLQERQREIASSGGKVK